MRGRKPKPTALRVIEGNPGKRPLNKREPVAVGELTTPPDWMTDEQKASWTYAIENAPIGVLRMIDQCALVVWVVAEAMHREATMQLAKSTLLTKTDTGAIIQNPYLPIVNRQAQIMLKAAAEMGFTPSSRSRVVAEGGGTGKQVDDNPFLAHGRRPA